MFLFLKLNQQFYNGFVKRDGGRGFAIPFAI